MYLLRSKSSLRVVAAIILLSSPGVVWDSQVFPPILVRWSDFEKEKTNRNVG
jgi:hypothetical protein